MDSTLCLIPFFGGDSSAANSLKEFRLRDLKATVASLEGEIVIGVCNKEDYDTVLGLGHIVQLDCDPRFIPANLCRHFQPQNLPYEYVYVTEADQVCHINSKVLKMVGIATYLVPHRVEELGEQGEGADRGLVVDYDGKRWVLPNGEPRGTNYYSPVDNVEQFGGAFLATVELFKKVNFIDSQDMPVEHTTGLDIAKTGYCLKTSNWQDFWVDHLSGKEFHDRQGGRIVG